MAGMLRMYRSLVDRYPYTTQILATGVLSTSGDLIVQMIEQRNKQQLTINKRRAAVMAAIGLGLTGPLCSVSLRYLHLFKIKPLPSVAVDQLVTCPIILSGFVTIHPLLSGIRWEKIQSNLWTSFTQLQLRAWMVWVPVQLCTFFVVPYQLRVLFIQVVALFWNMFLSYRANSNNMEISGDTPMVVPPTYKQPRPQFQPLPVPTTSIREE